MPLTVNNAPKTEAASGGRELLRITSNQSLHDAKMAAQAEERRQFAEPVNTLSAYVTDRWMLNKQHRENSGIETDMLNALKARNNDYSAEKLAQLTAQGGTKVFIGLTGVKCRAAEAWISDIIRTDTTKVWKLTPSPIPELPKSDEVMISNRVMQEFRAKLDATGEALTPEASFKLAGDLRDEADDELMADAIEKAERMERKVHDQMTEGGWTDTFEEFVTDVVTLKAGIIKGPVLERRKVLKWKKSALGGRKVPDPQWVIVFVYKRVSPFDIYPSKGSVTCNDGDLVERVYYQRKNLASMRGVDGYDVEAINLVLTQYGKSGLSERYWYDQSRARLEDKGDESPKDTNIIEGKEYWGSVQGSLLIERGVKKDDDGRPVQALGEYEINAIQIGSYLIYLQFNPDPLGHRPYSKSGYAKIPGSFWYKGVPELMEDLQAICNASVRALINNMAMASGPQTVYNDVTRFAKGYNPTHLEPWGVHQFGKAQAGSTEKPMEFVDVPSNATELLGIYREFSRMADDWTGIPAYAYGNPQVAGAGRTLGGLGMLMNSAARGIKNVIFRIDRLVVRPIVRRQCDYNLMYDDDDSIKGDVEIQAHGAMAQIIKEQLASSRMEFISNISNNEIAQRIVGIEGMANVLREAAESLEMDDGAIIPNQQKIKELAVLIEQERAAQQQAISQQQAA